MRISGILTIALAAQLLAGLGAAAFANEPAGGGGWGGGGGGWRGGGGGGGGGWGGGGYQGGGSYGGYQGGGSYGGYQGGGPYGGYQGGGPYGGYQGGGSYGGYQGGGSYGGYQGGGSYGGYQGGGSYGGYQGGGSYGGYQGGGSYGGYQGGGSYPSGSGAAPPRAPVGLSAVSIDGTSPTTDWTGSTTMVPTFAPAQTQGGGSGNGAGLGPDPGTVVDWGSWALGNGAAYYGPTTDLGSNVRAGRAVITGFVDGANAAPAGTSRAGVVLAGTAGAGTKYAWQQTGSAISSSIFSYFTPANMSGTDMMAAGVATADPYLVVGGALVVTAQRFASTYIAKAGYAATASAVQAVGAAFKSADDLYQQEVQKLVPSVIEQSGTDDMDEATLLSTGNY